MMVSIRLFGLFISVCAVASAVTLASAFGQSKSPPPATGLSSHALQQWWMLLRQTLFTGSAQLGCHKPADGILFGEQVTLEMGE